MPGSVMQINADCGLLARAKLNGIPYVFHMEGYLRRYPGSSSWYYDPGAYSAWPGCTARAELFIEPHAAEGIAIPPYYSSISAALRYEIPYSDVCQVDYTVDTNSDHLYRVAQALPVP
ncbi:MAG: hypothetical protein HYZ71_12235 [Deltaproteobacteria bacterium]|nr:hypothetical protein [Deltaproteobacteria bacterium]